MPDQWWGPSRSGRAASASGAGSLLGCLVGGYIAKRAGADVWLLVDCLAPGLLWRRASGGSATGGTRSSSGSRPTCPGGSKIDPTHRPLGYDRPAPPTTRRFSTSRSRTWPAAASCYCIDRRFRSAPPGLFALYVALYSFGRFVEELLRVDPAHHILGLRVNTWVSIVVFVARGVSSGGSSSRSAEAEAEETAAPPPAGPKMAIPRAASGTRALASARGQ